jgi:hypothetical protein
MIAYNKTWLANLRSQQQVKENVERGNISHDEFKAIAEKYPVGFYTPNIFVRVGLFIVTCIIVLFADGLLTLMAAGGNIAETGGWAIFLGLLSYGALELMINLKYHFRSGVDDALLFTAGCAFIGGFAMLLYKTTDAPGFLPLAILVFMLTLYLTIRFADMLAVAVCCASFFWMVFLYWTRVAGVSTAPFIMMLVSGVIYWAARKYSGKKEAINYDNCFGVVQILSLIALYAAGNYYVIATLSIEMMNQTGPVAFGAFFWVWTIAIPFIYIGFGIKQKNVILLRTGLLLVTAAVLTFRNYYHLLPVDVMLTIAGAALLSIVYALMRYLKTPKHGFTCAEPDKVNALDHLKIESLIVAETFAHTPSAPANDGAKFGGGDFGGGGSSGGF